LPSGFLSKTPKLESINLKVKIKSTAKHDSLRSSLLLSSRQNSGHFQASLDKKLENSDLEQLDWKDESFIEGPYVCGWRPHVVLKRCQNLVSGSAKEIELEDLFPECNAEEIFLLLNFVRSEKKLDGSLIHMREAMVLVAKCKNLMEHAEKNKISSARTIYVTLLTLCYFFSQDKMISVPAKEDISKSLIKPAPFERIYKDTIRCVLSKADYQIMNTTEKEMLESVASLEIQRMRIGFGFHF
jgi:hypothetical protein